ncbi:NADH-quinone oxidoreductase subunit D-related protein [Aurantimonas marina]|uniref:NADH-quinone oxidoreductase subunit D-related protein n=1 Tax=Aurantimonas marina TaxID=2780508 RepID=UPI0019CF7583|nr:hypothetical protein [Aurantimonas marina]
MGLIERLRNFAFATPTAFPVVGAGGERAWNRLVGDGAVSRTTAPHNGDILLLTGLVPPSWNVPLRDLFETFALPRAVVWLRPAGADPTPTGLPVLSLDHWDAQTVRGALLDPAAVGWKALHDDVPPAEWRGKGDYGQGGEGMMGGKPYGRPMAMTMMDTDGLNLGDLPTGLGPFFPHLPSGLHMKLHLQGARVRECGEARFLEADVHPDDLLAVGVAIAPFLRATRGQPMAIRELETARMRHHLARIADMLALAGLEGLARRALAVAGDVDAPTVRDGLSEIERANAETRFAGFGLLDRRMIESAGMAGFAARAAGLPLDRRDVCEAYRDLGFEPLVEEAGDTAARFRLLVRESRQSLDLIARAGDKQSTAAETPTGPLSETAGAWRSATGALLAHLPMLLGGRLFSEAVMIVASLSLSNEEAMLP